MSVKPSEVSSSLMRLLTTDGLVRSSVAALVKLRCCATRTKVLSLFRSRSAAVKNIVQSNIGRFQTAGCNFSLLDFSTPRVGVVAALLHCDMPQAPEHQLFSFVSYQGTATAI